MLSRLVGHLKAQVRRQAVRRISSQMDRFRDALLAADSDDDIQGFGQDLNTIERWVLVQKVLAEVPHQAIHFLHIPKTGGTTLTSALGADPRFMVVSVDGQAEVFFQQLRHLISEKEPKIAFIRAHHGLSLVTQSGASEHVAFSFATIREPAEIHASNANMIVRRINQFLDDGSRSEEEKEYASRWLEIMHGQHENTERFAIEVISTPEYHREMGSVYAKMFDSFDWQDALKREALLCFCKEGLDELFSDALGYARPPGRENVSTRGPLQADRIPSNVLARLIGDDDRIYADLSRHATHSKAVTSQFRDLIKAQ